MAHAPNFKLALTRAIEPTGGPGVELSTLEDAARFVAMLRPWRQADESVAYNTPKAGERPVGIGGREMLKQTVAATVILLAAGLNSASAEDSGTITFAVNVTCGTWTTYRRMGQPGHESFVLGYVSGANRMYNTTQYMDR
jgi:hypothetical protein